jgi:AcrR family transcriptional regulator
METIARDAGYFRAAMYRQFPNREHPVDALIRRTTQRHMVRITERQHVGAGPVDVIVTGLVMVATELAQDPLLKTIWEASEEGTIAQMLANSTAVTQLAEPLIEAMLREDDGKHFRRDIRAHDLTQYLIATALSLLLGIIRVPKTSTSRDATSTSSYFPPSSAIHPSRGLCSVGR